MIYFVPMDLTMHIFLCLFSLIITGDTTTQIMKLILGEDSLPGLRQLCIIVVAFSVMLPLCLLRDIGMLEKFSTMSVFTVFIVAILVFIKLVGKGVAGDVAAPVSPRREVWVVAFVEETAQEFHPNEREDKHAE